MTQDEIDKWTEALRDQGLTLGQTMFAVSLILEAMHTEREACAQMLEKASKTGKIISCTSAAKAIRARGQA